MMLWLIFTLLAGATVAGLAIPLVRWRPPALDRLAYDLAVYRDQIKEIERDVARGVMEAEQAEAARIEIQRRILAAGDIDAKSPAPLNATRRWIVILLIAILLPVASFALYTFLGAPELGGKW